MYISDMMRKMVKLALKRAAKRRAQKSPKPLRAPKK